MTLERDLHRSNWRRVSVIAAIVISVNGLGLVANYNLPERTVLGSKLHQTEQELHRSITKQSELTSYNADLNDRVRVLTGSLDATKGLPTHMEWGTLKKEYNTLYDKHEDLTQTISENESDLAKLRVSVVAKDKEIIKLKKDLQAKPKERIVYKDKIVYRDKPAPKVSVPKNASTYASSDGKVSLWKANGNVIIKKGDVVFSYAPTVSNVYCSKEGKTYSAYRGPSGNSVVLPSDGGTLGRFNNLGEITRANICSNTSPLTLMYRQ